MAEIIKKYLDEQGVETLVENLKIQIDTAVENAVDMEELGEMLDTKVDKVVGKELSTNDFTDELKEKLEEIDVNPEKQTVTDLEKQTWDDKYTKEETENLVNGLLTDLDWKPAVDTVADLTVVYPDAKDGWAVGVRENSYTYRFNGTEWIVISYGLIPLATHETDGLLSAEDKLKLDSIIVADEDHQSVTQEEKDRWNDTYTKPETNSLLENKLDVSAYMEDEEIIDIINKVFNPIVETIRFKK